MKECLRRAGEVIIYGVAAGAALGLGLSVLMVLVISTAALIGFFK